MAKDPRFTSASPADAELVRAAIERTSVEAFAERARLSSESVLRVAAGAPVQRATLSVAVAAAREATAA